MVLPHKERFTETGAGAIARCCQVLLDTPDGLDKKIIGVALDNPLDTTRYIAAKPGFSLFHSRNMRFAKGYCQAIRTGLIPAPDCIEVHSRCQVAAFLARTLPEIPVILYLHNDAREMVGGRTVGERKSLLERLAGIITVSDYLRQAFMTGLELEEADARRIITVHNGVERFARTPTVKDPLILFAGRIVPEKGVLQLAEALADTLPKYPDWRAIVAGAHDFAQGETKTGRKDSYGRRVAETLKPLGDAVSMPGLLDSMTLRDCQQRAAIICVPSVFQEPFGLVVAEAMAAGAALIASRRGGIPEITADAALLLETPDRQSLAAALERLMTDDSHRMLLQQRAWTGFRHTTLAMRQTAAQARLTLLGKI